MDKRLFAALMTLAAAPGALPGLTAELQAAAVQGPSAIKHDTVLRSVYEVAITRDGVKVGTKAFMNLGYGPSEAAQLANMAHSLAIKAGSYDRFVAIATGRAPSGVALNPRDRALLRSLNTGASGHGKSARLHTGWDSHTWEGRAVASHNTSVARGIWDGRTWEGSAVRKVPDSKVLPDGRAKRLD